uniref:Uncharacterized protein n=1 Tax=Strigamia maritima TaxID=126957 RepID=T1IT41_STRMM
MISKLRPAVLKKTRQLVGNHISSRNANYAFISILRYVTKKKLNWRLRLFWTIILGVSVLLCIALIHNRFAHYMSEPSIVNTYNQKENNIQFPTALLCTTSTPEFTEFALKVDNGVKQQDMAISCMAPLVKYNEYLSASKLWLMLNTSHIIDSISTLQNSSVNLKEKVKYVYSPLGLCVLITFENENFNLAKATDVPSKFRVLSLVSIQKYEFLNKTNKQCSLIEEFELCETKCIRQQIEQSKVKCRLPFMLGYNELPDCEEKYNLEYSKACDDYYGLWKANTSIDCKCIIPCKQQIISTRLIVEEKSGSAMRIQVLDSLRIAKEVATYDFIALLCDLGGNIGLTLGVSCLMIAEMLIILITLIIQNIKTSKKKSSRRLILESKVQKCFKQYVYGSGEDMTNRFQLPGLQYILVKQNDCHKRKYWWIFLITFSSVVCGFQIIDRIRYYLSYPKTISVQMIVVEDIELPSIVLCADSSLLQFKKERYMKKNQIHGCSNDFDMLNMVNDEISVNQLWTWSKKSQKFMVMKSMVGKLLKTLQLM